MRSISAASPGRAWRNWRRWPTNPSCSVSVSASMPASCAATASWRPRWRAASSSSRSRLAARAAKLLCSIPVSSRLLLVPTTRETNRMAKKPSAAKPGISAILTANFKFLNMAGSFHGQCLDTAAQRGAGRDVSDGAGVAAHEGESLLAGGLFDRWHVTAGKDHLLPVSLDGRSRPPVDLLREAFADRRRVAQVDRDNALAVGPVGCLLEKYLGDLVGGQRARGVRRVDHDDVVFRAPGSTGGDEQSRERQEQAEGELESESDLSLH